MEPQLRRMLSVVAALLLALSLWLVQESTLYSLYFLTGWLLFGGLALDLWWRWQRSALSPRPSRWIGIHAGIAVAVATLFFVHLEFRAPHGWIGNALLVMFLLLFLSGAVGLLIRLGLRFGLINGAVHGPRLARRWVMVHVPLEASLLALALVHALLVHGHGAMARVALGH